MLHRSQTSPGLVLEKNDEYVLCPSISISINVRRAEKTVEVAIQEKQKNATHLCRMDTDTGMLGDRDIDTEHQFSKYGDTDRERDTNIFLKYNFA